MKIVTVCGSYVDADAYGAIIGYAELLKLQGEDAQAVLPAESNNSVTPTLKSLPAEYTVGFDGVDGDFIVLDVSIPEQIEKQVGVDKVIELIDHHPGFEDFWKNKLGDEAIIEPIGSVCTIIYEKWVTSGLLNKVFTAAARLLMAGILDNTLNFNAEITKDRDRKAYEELAAHANYDGNFAADYFSEVQEGIENGLEYVIKNDTKQLNFKTHDSEITFAQLAVWNAEKVLRCKSELTEIMSSGPSHWLLNILDISEKKTYFLTDSQEIFDWLSGVIETQQKDDTLISNRLYLRKEILRADEDKHAAK